MERFIKKVTQSAITNAPSFKSRAGRPSRPVAFSSFRHLSCLSTNGLPTAVNSKCFFVNNSWVVVLKTGLADLQDSNNLFTTDVKKVLNNSEMLCLSVIILSSALIQVGIDLILCSTICVPCATRHNIHMYPYFLFVAIHHLKSSPTFSVQPCSSVGRVTEDLIRRSWVRFPRRSKDFFFALCGSLFPFTRANAQWVIHGFK